MSGSGGDESTPETIVHLVRAPDWAAGRQGDSYVPESLAVEGFIHLCTDAQVSATVARWYPDATDLLAVTVETATLGGALRWEDTYGHGRFPHLHGPLPLSAVVGVTPHPGPDPIPRSPAP